MMVLGQGTPAATCLLILCLLATGCHGNQFDPHLYPSNGPFFEGWYVRLMDPAQQFSLGFLHGRVLPAKNSSAGTSASQSPAESQKCKFSSQHCAMHKQQGLPLVYASVLVQDNNVSQKLQSYNGAFPARDYSVTVQGGKPVVQNPDDESPPDFSVKLGNNGSFVVTADGTLVNVAIGNVRLYIKASNPVPWGPHGEGPESWLDHLPLPLHWFVYSLRSTVTQYKFTDAASGRIVSGGNARLHMEKNWGETFPTAWVWSQGVTKSNVNLALSGGIVHFIRDVTAFLVGYRNPGKNIVWNFTPANSRVSFVHDGCNGAFNLNLTSVDHKLALKVSSPMSSFSDCLLGPEKYGFRPACVESYNAVASVRAYKRNYFHFEEVDRAEIPQAALEFGGTYVCKQKCSGI
ncbi:uncharacterized protein [Littorina saxatilis]|uniref:Uncharacterized protein n=2 Tax=Littorina saxatilis TaxID=31220 RepID=A0AAN9FXH8_9CAEN